MFHSILPRGRFFHCWHLPSNMVEPHQVRSPRWRSPPKLCWMMIRKAWLFQWLSSYLVLQTGVFDGVWVPVFKHTIHGWHITPVVLLCLRWSRSSGCIMYYQDPLGGIWSKSVINVVVHAWSLTCPSTSRNKGAVFSMYHYMAYSGFKIYRWYK